MNNIVKRESDAHWYYPDGTPCHQVEKKSEPGTFRPTTLTDAKKLGLLASVTTKLKLLNEGNLVAWQIEQAIIAALTLPREPDEVDDAFAHRIAEDASAQVAQAADWGTLMHGAIADYLLISKKPVYELLYPQWRKVEEFLVENIESVEFAERVLVASDYAGTCDLCAWFRGPIGDALEKDFGTRKAIADFKTRKAMWNLLKKHPDGGEWRITTYPKDGYQLSAYSWIHGEIPVVSILIPRNLDEKDNPLDVRWKVWSKEEQAKNTRIWQQINTLYNIINFQ